MSTLPTQPENLFQQLLQQQTDKHSSLPPVESWNPESCGDIDIRIARDGSWFHEGGRMKRPAMVKMFSSILKREGDEYFLITPVEKCRIQVEDAPFVVTTFSVENPGQEQAIVFTTNTEDQVILGADNPLWVDEDPETAEPSPYVQVRRNLPALIHRNVFYQLVELAEEREEGDVKTWGVWSLGKFFPLGTDL